MQNGMSKQQHRGYLALNVLLFVFTGVTLLSFYTQPDVPIALSAMVTNPAERANTAQPIDLNLAQPTDLLRVKGLGSKTVTHIDYCRKCLGGFTDKRQLLRVPGIGASTLARLARQLVLTELGLHLWRTHPALIPWRPEQTKNLNAIETEALYRVCVLEKDAARRILSKRESLGGFRNWRDVAPLKGVGWHAVAKLQDHFHIAPPAVIALNHSTKTDLDRLPGVGKKTAERIIAYREQLGGFYALEQLDEVRGIGPKTMAGFRGRLQSTAPQSELRKLDLMQATPEQLAQHPYISDQQASTIISIRLSESPSSTTLLERGVFTPVEMQRLKPYLSNFE